MLQVSFFPTVSELAYRLHLFPTLQRECRSCIARQLAPGTRAQSHAPQAVCWHFFGLVSYTPPLMIIYLVTFWRRHTIILTKKIYIKNRPKYRLQPTNQQSPIDNVFLQSPNPIAQPCFWNQTPATEGSIGSNPTHLTFKTFLPLYALVKTLYYSVSVASLPWAFDIFCDILVGML